MSVFVWELKDVTSSYQESSWSHLPEFWITACDCFTKYWGGGEYIGCCCKSFIHSMFRAEAVFVFKLSQICSAICQGCGLSPLLFFEMSMDRILRQRLSKAAIELYGTVCLWSHKETSWRVRGKHIEEFIYVKNDHTV